MTPIYRRRPRALLLAIPLIYAVAIAAPVPAAAMQILDAADHGELAAEISATGVNRIALMGDRIAKVVRAPDGFAVEHDAGSGDLYLRPAGPRPGTHPAEVTPDREPEPVTLFIGTEKGFTYRLTLTPAERDSAQILIRNARALPAAAAAPALAGDPRMGTRGGPHVAALVRLVRAVARREPLPGYAIAAGSGPAFFPASRSSRPGGARASGPMCLKRRPSPPLRQAGPGPPARRPGQARHDPGRRASPGPSEIPWARAVSPRSGWRRPAPGPPAGGSPWRSWTRPAGQRPGESRDERPRGWQRRRWRCGRGAAAPAAAVLGHRRRAAGGGGRVARHGRRQGPGACGAASRPGSWSRTRPRRSGQGAPRPGSAASRPRCARCSRRRAACAPTTTGCARSWRPDAADALRTIDRPEGDDRRAAARRLQPPAATWQGNAPGNDPWFRGQAAAPPPAWRGAAGRAGAHAHDRDLRAQGRAPVVGERSPERPRVGGGRRGEAGLDLAASGISCRKPWCWPASTPPPGFPPRATRARCCCALPVPPGPPLKTGPPCRSMSTAAR